MTHPLKRTAITSSNLHSAAYCKDCDSLYVAFKNGSGDAASLYKVEPQEGQDVKALYDGLMAASADDKASAGKFYHSKIRPLTVKKVDL